MPETFVEDPRIQSAAEAYSLRAVDFARDQFKLSLDWSDASVAHIETILDEFHRHAAVDKPTEAQIYEFAKQFGSYVGEVFRKNHGAAWGLVTLQHESFPGMKAAGSAELFWPWGRAHNRILNGEEDNVWHYYQALLRKAGVVSASSPPPAKRVTWWQRLRKA